MNKDTWQAIALLLILILLCLQGFSQDTRSKYWQYSDSMFAARKNKDSIKQNKYLDSMNKYCHFDARKKQKN